LGYKQKVFLYIENQYNRWGSSNNPRPTCIELVSITCKLKSHPRNNMLIKEPVNSVVDHVYDDSNSSEEILNVNDNITLVVWKIMLSPKGDSK
jgi:hypothetical protein